MVHQILSPKGTNFQKFQKLLDFLEENQITLRATESFNHGLSGAHTVIEVEMDGKSYTLLSVDDDAPETQLPPFMEYKLRWNKD